MLTYREFYFPIKSKITITLFVLTVFKATVALEFRVGLDDWLIFDEKDKENLK